MKVSDVYPPRGNHYERLDQMDYFRTLYSKLIRDYYKDKGYFELPSSTFRFSPIKYSGCPFTRSNRVILYYMATMLGYDDSRIWVNPSDAIDIGYPLFNYELDRYSVINENGLFDTRKHPTYSRMQEYERRWLRYSVTPYVNSQLIKYSIEGMDSVRIISPAEVLKEIRYPRDTEVRVSDRFYYDESTDRLYHPEPENCKLSIFDYLFNLVKVSVEAEGKFFRTYRRNRSTKFNNINLKRVGEDFVQRLASLMILSSLGLDISNISDEYVRFTGWDYKLLMNNLATKDHYLYRWSNQAYDAYEILYIIPDSNYTK